MKLYCFLLLLGASCAETTAAWRDRMREEFQTVFDENNGIVPQATAFIVAVADPLHGDASWAFGNYEIGNETVPATVDDHFGIGSISKSFGATTYLRLAEDGVLDLDATVDTVAPGTCASEYDTYTLRELIGMRTCIPDAFNEPIFVDDMVADPAARPSLETIINAAVAGGVNESSPDCKMIHESIAAYSTTNYLCMELIAEKVTGRTIASLVAEYVLEPLNLHEMALPPRNSPGYLPEPAARPYNGQSCAAEFTLSNASVPTGWTIDEIYRSLVVVGTGGSMSSTISDLLAWAASGVGDTLLAPETLVERHEYHPMGGPDSLNRFRTYGLGQHTQEYIWFFDYGVPGDWRGHGGDSFGFASLAMRSDLHNASFAAVSNTCNLPEINTAALKKFNSDLEARAAATEAPTAQTMEPTATPESDAADRASAVGAAAVALLTLVA